MIASAPVLKQTKISLWQPHLDVLFQVDSQASRADDNLMDLVILLGGNRECQPDMVEAIHRCIHSLVVDAFNLVISSAEWPGLEPLHIACSVTLDLVYPVIWGSLSHFRKLHEISKEMMLTNCMELLCYHGILFVGEWRLGCCFLRLWIVNAILMIVGDHSCNIDGNYILEFLIFENQFYRLYQFASAVAATTFGWRLPCLSM